MQRPEFRKLIKLVQTELEKQKDKPFVAINKGFFTFAFHRREVEKAWPSVAKQLGLVDDGTGTDTWTLPGRGVQLHHLFR